MLISAYNIPIPHTKRKLNNFEIIFSIKSFIIKFLNFFIWGIQNFSKIFNTFIFFVNTFQFFTKLNNIGFYEIIVELNQNTTRFGKREK